MSEISQPAPYLSIKKLDLLLHEIDLAMTGDGWVLTNRLEREGDNINVMLGMFLFNSKAKYQCKSIVDNVSRIHKMIQDFTKGSFQFYVDNFKKWHDIENYEGEFDPYEEVERTLTTDYMDDLPDRLERFEELVSFSKVIDQRRKIMHKGIEHIFGGIDRYYLASGENGETIMVSEKDLSPEFVEDAKLRREIREERESIELEFCLDNYDAWLATLTEMIKERRPFSEILTLFKA